MSFDSIENVHLKDSTAAVSLSRNNILLTQNLGCEQFSLELLSTEEM